MTKEYVDPDDAMEEASAAVLALVEQANVAESCVSGVDAGDVERAVETARLARVAAAKMAVLVARLHEGRREGWCPWCLG